MATAFTALEKEQIRRQMMAVALRYASTVGMRHATVDEIAHEVGISKGAFYGFYESKELLFLEMIESIHEEMYGNAEKVLEENAELPISQRATRAIFEVYRVAKERNVMGFIREETPFMLRRLPPDMVREYYHSDEEHIRRLIQKGGVELTTGIDTVCTIVRLLLMTLLVKDEMGASYDEAMQHIIEGACRQVIRQE